MLSTLVLVLAATAEKAEESAGATPYYIGGTALGILFLSLLLVVAFGGGRDHS
ncbi:hypothetical protein GCM10011584_07250 [Nocardioides phosphati]|uniref:Uncharacterized protein n=1 Tax=Nocardioides phosphati TaxID=1867775 RepID=A0ABQ2N849_9ACTN|nr:hypothetical protein [Nocardioides phosphati]GGO85990.1 hypothetical protein GCM10011584_07250 [Nocardioides phosphati]